MCLTTKAIHNCSDSLLITLLVLALIVRSQCLFPRSSSRAPFLLDGMADQARDPSSAPHRPKRKDQRDLSDAASRNSDDEESGTRKRQRRQRRREYYIAMANEPSESRYRKARSWARRSIKEDLDSGSRILVLEYNGSNRTHCRASTCLPMQLTGRPNIKSDFRINLMATNKNDYGIPSDHSSRFPYRLRSRTR